MILYLAAALGADGAAPLDQAYQKEFAYLAAERAALDARIAELEVEAADRVARAEAEIDALQVRLVAATRAADRAEDAFEGIERETTAMDDARTLLLTTLDQAAETLSLTRTEDPVAAVPALFAAATARIDQASSAGWETGAFFLPDGRSVDGRIWRFGQVAAWGVSPFGSGALAPAGEGRLQLRRELGRITAEAFAADARPAWLEMHLFEPERGAEEAEKAGGLRQLLHDAGTMGQVLFGLGIVSALLATVRALTLLAARRGGMPLVGRVAQAVMAEGPERAAAALGRRGNPTARVLGAILDGADRTRGELERIVEEALLRELPRIDRFASALVVITAGAPLLGLLGTVTGMIATFDVITEHGTGNPKLMSAGIAEALVCTALGLAVAIPTLLVGNVLASVGASAKNALDRGALTLLNALEQWDRDRERERERGGDQAQRSVRREARR